MLEICYFDAVLEHMHTFLVVKVRTDYVNETFSMILGICGSKVYKRFHALIALFFPIPYRYCLLTLYLISLLNANEASPNSS